MALEMEVLESVAKGSPEGAWRVIINRALAITSKSLVPGSAPGEVTRRDREIGMLDHFLSSSCWDLWPAFDASVERTSDRIKRLWAEPYAAKAVLILDGLSLRELPWLLQGVRKYGLTLHEVAAYASELPGETNQFARALGFNSRSQLQNNGGGLAHRLQPAHTECVDLPWADCEGLISSAPNWVFWHHWPDSKLHDGSGAGQGLDTLTKDVAEQLGSSAFWALVKRLATGRRLAITSDHGYAASGYFSDAEGEVSQFLKKTFASGRSAPGADGTGPFVPPVALQVDSPHGPHLLAVGRRKWKSQGGYPTLTHGGLSLLEVLSPFIVLTR